MKRTVILLFFIQLMVLASCVNHVEQPTDKVPELPTVYVNLPAERLDSVWKDKDYRASALITIVDGDNDTLYDGPLTHFKTRGNSSFYDSKKPYSIKFPTKQKFFNLLRDKSFVLLANAKDVTNVKNAFGLDLANDIGLAASDYTYVRLFVNSKYEGLYQMTNHVEDCIEIEDLEKRNKFVNTQPLQDYQWFGLGRDKLRILKKGMLLEQEPIDISGGYLLDNVGIDEKYQSDLSGFVSEAGDPIRIRSPKYASRGEADYIAARYDEMEEAVKSPDGFNHKTGKHYSDYIDLESFCKYYLLNEFLLNIDGGYSSFLMYKNADDVAPKFYAGPAWDFDLSCGYAIGDVPHPYNQMWVNAQIVEKKERHSDGLLYWLWCHEDFRENAVQIWVNIVSPAAHGALDNGYFEMVYNELSVEIERDASARGKEVDEIKSQQQELTEFVIKRLDFMDWYFSVPADEMVTVSFAQGNRISHIYYPLGQPISLPSVSPNHDKRSSSEVLQFYYADSETTVENGSVFNDAVKLDLRWRPPTKNEVLSRKWKNGLRKISFGLYD